MSNAAELRELINISQFAGGDLLLVQGGGGNTSVKSADGARMWIKASGLRLSEVNEGYGYLETDLASLLALMRDPALAARPRAQAHAESVQLIQAATQSDTGLRPSLETTFHAVLGKVVLHTHPVYVNAFTCMEGGEAALAEASGESAVWARYEPPGYALGAEVDQVCTAYQADHGQLPAQVILSHHGLIASAANGAEAIGTTLKFMRIGETYFGCLPETACASAQPPQRLVTWAADLDRALRRRSGMESLAVRPTTRAALLEAAKEPDRWLTVGPLVPDDVVYSGHKVWKAQAARPPGAWLEAEIESIPPAGKMIVAVAGLGVILAGPSHKILEAMEENLLTHVLVRRLIASRGGCARTLPPAEVDYLLAMESETYRQAIAAGPS
jgi:rhamnose utilization protein RhaD (predicted bifunctional aldolase and dehydrogenase)